MYINSPEVRELAQRVFPSYNGRRYAVEPLNGPMTTTSCWNGGSRDYCCLVNLVTNKTWSLPENGTPFVSGGRAFKVGRLPGNIALIRHKVGGYEYVTIYLNPANIRADMLPQKPVLTWGQTVVMVATRSLKSSYGGISHYRRHAAQRDTGITIEEWEIAKAECQAKGFLNRAGAITDDGRNAVGFDQLHNLKRPVPAAHRCGSHQRRLFGHLASSRPRSFQVSQLRLRQRPSSNARRHWRLATNRRDRLKMR